MAVSIERVKRYFQQWNIEDRILEFDVSSATVELAAQALGCEGARIAKSLSLQDGHDGAVLVVAAGDARLDNHKFKEEFGIKPKMLRFEEVEPLVGHAVGGVCPFALNEGIEVFLDVSMKRFPTIFPACGSANSAIELTMTELEKYSRAEKWVDVCKNWH